MKILLTGAQGQLGRAIIALAVSPIQLLAFSRREFDICELEAVRTGIAQHRPQLVINAAAYTAVDRAEQEQPQAFAVNAHGVKNLALACKEYEVPVIHLSTDYVFAGNQETAYTEEAPTCPVNVYGRSKAAGEEFLQAIWEKHLIIRVSWLFGHHGHNFVKTMLGLATQQPKLRVVSDQYGYPTFVPDLAKTLLLLAEHVQSARAQWGIFHYRGDQALSWFDFAQEIVSQARLYASLRCQEILAIRSLDYAQPAKRPQNALLNMDKIQRIYGIEPSPWRSGLTQMIKNYFHATISA